jgi:hypothetical protein
MALDSSHVKRLTANCTGSLRLARLSCKSSKWKFGRESEATMKPLRFTRPALERKQACDTSDIFDF